MKMDNQDKVEKAKEEYEKKRNYFAELAKEKKLPAARSLTRNERKELDAANLNFFKIKSGDPRNVFEIKDEMFDWMAEHIFKDFKFDSTLPNNVCVSFADFVFGMTYRDDFAEKN